MRTVLSFRMLTVIGIPPQIDFRIKKKEEELGTITGKQKQGNMAQGSNIVTRLQFPSMHLAFMMASFSARHKFIQNLHSLSPHFQIQWKRARVSFPGLAKISLLLLESIESFSQL